MKPYIIAFGMLGLLVGGPLIFGWPSRPSATTPKYALVRCMLPTGIMYTGYTKEQDLRLPSRGRHALLMVDAKSRERLAFSNTMCVVSYDRSLP